MNINNAILIPLTHGAGAIIDAEDYDLIMSYGKWHLTRHGYARTTVGKNNYLMHRIINKTPEGLYTDHINRIRLDNRKSNLRTVTHKENYLNSSPPRLKSKYLDLPHNITWDKSRSKYIAGSKYILKRRFNTLEEAKQYLNDNGIIPLKELEPLELTNDIRSVI